jgi:hypothetical protein
LRAKRFLLGGKFMRDNEGALATKGILSNDASGKAALRERSRRSHGWIGWWQDACPTRSILT